MSSETTDLVLELIRQEAERRGYELVATAQESNPLADMCRKLMAMDLADLHEYVHLAEAEREEVRTLHQLWRRDLLDRTAGNPNLQQYIKDEHPELAIRTAEIETRIRMAREVIVMKLSDLALEAAERAFADQLQEQSDDAA